MKKENLVKFYQAYQLYIFPAAIILSCLILIVFVIYPQTQKLIGSSKTQQDLISKTKFLQAKAQTLESFDEADLQRKVSFSLSAFPSEKDFGTAIGLLQNLTSQSGFNIVSLAVSSGSQKSGSSESYSVKVEILGPKNLFASLLSAIENSPRIMRVNSVDISSVKAGDILNVALGIEIFYAPLPSSFGSADSPLPQLSDKDEELIVKLAGETPASVSESTPTVSLPPRGKANPFE